jgi:hypothetical protein
MRASTKTNRPRSISRFNDSFVEATRREGWIGDIGANFDSLSPVPGRREKPFNYLVGKPQSELDLEWEASNVTRV